MLRGTGGALYQSGRGQLWFSRIPCPFSVVDGHAAMENCQGDPSEGSRTRILVPKSPFGSCRTLYLQCFGLHTH
jgi:hypothetical protein